MIINCHFKTKESLYLAYMPFIQGGGIFIETKTQYDLGAPRALTVRLLDELAQYTVSGKVVWITPNEVQSTRPIGIGVQFQEEDGRIISNKIQSILGESAHSAQLTHTM